MPRLYHSVYPLLRAPESFPLIRQMAHFIAEDFAERGYPDVTVKADAFVFWNGRANARLIDADVDLARVESGVGAKDWVLV